MTTLTRAAPDREEVEALDRETLEGLDEPDRAELTGGFADSGPSTRGPGPARLFRNFRPSGFHCCRGHCAAASVPSAAVPSLPRLVRRVLQPPRDEFGLGTVHSGYRNEAHNAHVDGGRRRTIATTKSRRSPRPTSPSTGTWRSGGRRRGCAFSSSARSAASAATRERLHPRRPRPERR